MALRRRHIFLDMQYECDTSKAARGTGADLSIHRLEPTVAQRPYTAVGTSPCSRNPFSPSGVLLNSSACVNLACRRESGTWCARLSSDSRQHEGCVVQRNGVCRLGCQFNFPNAHQLNQDDSSSRRESPWPVQGPTVSNSQLNTEIKPSAHEWSKLKSELVTVISLGIDIGSRQTKYRRGRHVVYLGA